jgi:hypothetical protein
MENFFLHSTSLNDLKTIIGEVVQEKLQQFKPEYPQPQTEEFITRRQVCSLLKISLSTLHYYSKDGILKAYRIGGRILYKTAEIQSSIHEIQTTKYKHWWRGHDD